MQVRYVGDSLTALAGEGVKAATAECARSIAEQAQDVMFDTARHATPSRSGRTRDSWLKHDIQHHGNTYEARIVNDWWVAHLLNYGTEPHHIGPKHKRAILEIEGPRAGADVSGITPRFMIEQAAARAQATLEQATILARQRWAHEAEAAIQAAKRHP